MAGSHKRTSLHWNSVDYGRKKFYSIGRTQKSFCGWGMEGEHCTQKEREKSKKEKKKYWGWDISVIERQCAIGKKSVLIQNFNLKF